MNPTKKSYKILQAKQQIKLCKKCHIYYKNTHQITNNMPNNQHPTNKHQIQFTI